MPKIKETFLFFIHTFNFHYYNTSLGRIKITTKMEDVQLQYIRENVQNCHDNSLEILSSLK